MVATDIDARLESPDPDDPIFTLHRGGKMEVAATVPLRDADDLSKSYTPGVARFCEAIVADPRPPTSTPGSPTPSLSSPTEPPCWAWVTSDPPPRCR